MKAIILCGGQGTRLRHVLPDGLPKAMAPIGVGEDSVPFLQILLQKLYKSGIHRVIFAVGYGQNKIIDYFKFYMFGMDFEYSCEDEPLGTGGALKKALKMVEDDQVFVLNGDTYFDIDYDSFLKYHNDTPIEVTVAYSRQYKKPGGVYVVNSNALDNVPDVCSFEQLIIDNKISCSYWLTDGYFIDIGTPKEYARARKELI